MGAGILILEAPVKGRFDMYLNPRCLVISRCYYNAVARYLYPLVFRIVIVSPTSHLGNCKYQFAVICATLYPHYMHILRYICINGGGVQTLNRTTQGGTHFGECLRDMQSLFSNPSIVIYYRITIWISEFCRNRIS